MAASEGEPAAEAAGRSHLALLRAPATLRAWLGPALNLLLLSLFALLLYRNRAALPDVVRLLSPLRLLSCAALYLASLLLQLAIWTDLMGYRRAEWREAADHYIRTIFLGRLPGGLWKLAGRLTVYRPPRLSRRATLVINLVELGLLLGAAGCLLLGLTPLRLPLRMGAIVALLLVLLLLMAAARPWLPRLAPPRQALRWLFWLAGYLAVWFCAGLIVYLLLGAGQGSPPIGLGLALRLWCLASGAGLLLQILPLSSLIRDSTLSLLLHRLLPLEQAITAALAIRLVLQGCELASGWGLLWLLRLPRAGSGGPGPGADSPLGDPIPEG